MIPDKISMGMLLKFFVLIIFSACAEKVSVSVSGNSAIVKTPTDTTPLRVTINRALTETVGSCSFDAISGPTNKTGFSFRVTFSGPINPSTFTISDIVRAGSGGSIGLEWELMSCGDGVNFKLTALDVEGNGPVIPTINAGSVFDLSANPNLASTSTDNSVSFLREWVQEAYIKAPNPSANDLFGEKLYLDGDTLVVGVEREDSNQTTITATVTANDTRTDSGAVYVYRRTGSNWALEAYIKAANNDADDRFGNSIAINRDTLVVGADQESGNSTTIINGTGVDITNTKSRSGAVYIFKRTGTTWAQEAYIKAVNADVQDYFGSAVDVHGDTVAVGAPSERSFSQTIINGSGAAVDNSPAYIGAIYVYKRTGSTWAQEAYVKQSYPSGQLAFGSQLSLSKDTLVAGNENFIGANINDGSVNVFRRTGTTWAEEFKLVGHDNQRFGQFVSVDANTLVFSAPFDQSDQTTITNGTGVPTDTDTGSGLGAIYVYKRSGSMWTQEAYIKASNDLISFYSSDLLNLSIDGNTLVVGSKTEASNQATITNGNTASHDVSSLLSGAAYVFKRKGVLWSAEAYIKATNGEAGDEFGAAVSVSGDTIAVGAPKEDSNQSTITNGLTASFDNSLSSSGAIYIYRSNGRLFDVTDVWGSKTSSSITLNWHRTGGLATGYLVAYQMGAVAPADCSSGTVIDVGDVGTFMESPLSSATTYSFRVCATDGGEISTGSTVSLTTN